ncbi:MAG: prolyl oligopeptidase family serine peptidase [bacterium]|nr:prolyl oligopeptidase family serine peptidase [bacterium]
MLAEDYLRAERLLPWNVGPRVRNAEVRPNWIDDHCFWYERQTADGSERIRVDARTGECEPHQDADAAAGERIAAIMAHGLISPDGSQAVSCRDGNLILKTMTTGEERALTQDGEPAHAYGKSPDSNTFAVSARVAGIPLPPMALWSPDSTQLFTVRLDERLVSELHLLQSAPADGSARPALHSYRYAMAGDESIPEAELLVFDVETGKRIEADWPPIPAPLMSPVELQHAWWSDDGSRIYFIDLGRGAHECRLCEFDPSTGAVRRILEERSDTYLELNAATWVQPNVRIVAGGDEVVWYSERDGWGHLYLHDAASGKLLNPITAGEWLVRDILHVDEEARRIFFTASGREPDRDPYLRHIYRVDLDGSDLRLLAPEDGDHQVSLPPANDIVALAQVALRGGAPGAAGFSPSGHYFIDTWSRLDAPSVSVLRSADGELIRTLEMTDVSALLDEGWRWPEPFQVKARDGERDVFGAIHRPSHFDAEQRYPVIDLIYPGPQVIRTPKRSFPAEPFDLFNYTFPQTLAELGFVVVTLDGLGTPLRSRAFREAYYGRMEDAGGLEDHIAGLRQLGERHPWMDLDRVGITGHSGGGFASTRAVLAHPDFYKVAVSSAGNHDQRGYMSYWGEKYQGLADASEDSEDGYQAQANARLAENLQGKLLLIAGDMDDNVHPALTLQVANALVAANKDFDFLLLPNRNHQTSLLDPYALRRLWDYFVRHLLGGEPPDGYRIHGPA